MNLAKELRRIASNLMGTEPGPPVPARCFHAAPMKARKNILTRGIDYTNSSAKPKYYDPVPEWGGNKRPLGNYLYGNLYDALDLADHNIKGKFEIWAVNPVGLHLEKDPEPVGTAWYSLDPIRPPHLLGIIWSNAPDVPYQKEPWWPNS